MQLPLLAASTSFTKTQTWHVQSKENSLPPAGTVLTNAIWTDLLTVLSRTHIHIRTRTLSHTTHTVGVCNKLTMLHLLQVAEAFAQTTRSLRPNMINSRTTLTETLSALSKAGVGKDLRRVYPSVVHTVAIWNMQNTNDRDRAKQKTQRNTGKKWVSVTAINFVCLIGHDGVRWEDLMTPWYWCVARDLSCKTWSAAGCAAIL